MPLLVRPASAEVEVEPLRLAILGLGRMGRVHAAALADVAEVRVTAVADPDPAAREQAVTTLADAAGYADPLDALDHPEVDACLIAAPTPTHPALTDAALDRGRHVLCEKPLALDPADSQRLGTRARSSGLVLQVGFWRRFAFPWAEARRLLRAGTVGRPLLLRLSAWDLALPPVSFCDPAVSGGLAIDCGVHEFDLAEWLTGDRIVAVTGRDLPLAHEELAAVGDVDNLVALLDLAGGAVAIVDLSRNARYGDDVRTEILGTDGAVLVASHPRTRMWVGTSGGLREVDVPADTGVMDAGVAEQARVFARRIADPTLEVPDADTSSRTVEVALAVRAAATSGTTVQIL